MFTFEEVARTLLARTVTRRLEAPPRVQVIAVGGSTLGGSGKTPLAIACAKELAASGARVAIVGHAYRSDPRRARVVSPVDPIDEVGDEALLAARSLDRPGSERVSVVVAPTRGEAIARAARLADVLVLDGIAQLGPTPAALSLLAVDPERPWGRRPALPPRGSVRAPVETLVAACDAIVTVGEGRPADGLFELGRSVWPSRVDSRGVLVVGSSAGSIPGGVDEWVHEGTIMTLLPWPAVRALRVGLLTALARPERIMRTLAARGVVPRATVSTRDHGPFGGRARRRAAAEARDHGIDMWLATPKCALHAARDLPALRVAVVDHLVTLHPSLRKRLRDIASSDAQAMAAP